MPKSDSFFGRWSRRKLEAGIAAPAQPISEVGEEESPQPELPAVESLNGTSDYTAFLHKGVSAAIQQQALRRAWESDAAIASFRGMADYDWDFNAPTYGRLWAVDDVAKLLSDVLASPPGEQPSVEPERLDPGPRVIEALPVAEVSAIEPKFAEPEGPDPAPILRRHGSALPC